MYLEETEVSCTELTRCPRALQPAPVDGQLNWRLSAHPLTLLTFLAFRIAALLTYLLGLLFTSNLSVSVRFKCDLAASLADVDQIASSSSSSPSSSSPPTSTQPRTSPAAGWWVCAGGTRRTPRRAWPNGCLRARRQSGSGW